MCYNTKIPPASEASEVGGDVKNKGGRTFYACDTGAASGEQYAGRELRDAG